MAACRRRGEQPQQGDLDFAPRLRRDARRASFHRDGARPRLPVRRERRGSAGGDGVAGARRDRCPAPRWRRAGRVIDERRRPVARRCIERDAAAIAAIEFAACGVFRDGGSSRWARRGARLVSEPRHRCTMASGRARSANRSAPGHRQLGGGLRVGAGGGGSRAGRPRASRALAATLMARHDRVRAARGSGVSARVQRDGCGLAGARAHAATGHPDPLRFVARALGARRICADVADVGRRRAGRNKPAA